MRHFKKAHKARQIQSYKAKLFFKHKKRKGTNLKNNTFAKIG